jgi:hypothetical protein
LGILKPDIMREIVGGLSLVLVIRWCKYLEIGITKRLKQTRFDYQMTHWVWFCLIIKLKTFIILMLFLIWINSQRK